MKKLIHLTVSVLVLLAGLQPAAAQGSKFTYQGRFNDGGAPANGNYDLTFSLFKLDVGGSVVAGPVTNSPVAVSNGLFTTSIDFGAGIFEGTTFWLQIAARTNGGGAFTDLTPRQELTPTPYAMYAEASPIADNSVTSAKIVDGTISSLDLGPNSVNSGHIIDGQVGNADLANDAVSTGKILDGTITSADIADGTITTSDLSLASVDARYVLKAGDTMTGNLNLLNAGNAGDILIENTFPFLTFNRNSASGNSGIHFEDNGANAGWIYLRSSDKAIAMSAGTAAVVQNDFVLQTNGNVGIGTALSAAESRLHLLLPNSVSVPNFQIQSLLGNNGFGIKFTNPDETWFVGPNIGNWADDRFTIMSDSANKGIIVAANGNVAIDSVSAASPFATLTVDGTIGFPTVSTPMMYVYPSGTANAQKPVIVHSPAFPEYGLYYEDNGDRFVMKSSAADTTPSLVVDLDSNWVAIGTDTPKPGYELSVNGQIVCEELLVEDSANWPDYVFKDDYALRPLAEVEKHIKERKHLPGVPTAADVEKDGLRIGDMQKRMMEKIEELTLYVIDQNKRLVSQEQRIEQLQSQLQGKETRP